MSVKPRLARRARHLATTPAVLAAVLAAAICPAAAAREPLPADLMARLQGWLDTTRQLEARFEQTLLSGALGAGLSESGTLYLERPGRMRWEYAEPERKTALIDGSRIELYLPEDEQLIRSTIDDDGDLLPRLLVGQGRLADLFEPEPPGVPAEDGAGPRLGLRPRGRTDSFERVVLTLRREDYGIERALVLDAAGNEIEYRFSAMRRNRGLPPDAFILETPAGTEVVGPGRP